MKNFVFKMFLFIGMLILIFTILEFFIFPISNNQMTLKNKLIQKDKDVLILGNSYTFFRLNLQILVFKMVNIANKGRKLETDYSHFLKNKFNYFADENLIIIDGNSLNIKSDILFENTDYLNVHRTTIFTQKMDSILKLY